MIALQETLEKDNPFVLTQVDWRILILRKDNPVYTPKRNDRVLSIDCVLANSNKLEEIEEGVFELTA